MSRPANRDLGRRMGKQDGVRKKADLGAILIVEDDPVLALNLEATLTERGARQVTISPTTQDALEALEENSFDAIVLDVHLADRSDGWTVAELVCELGPRPPAFIFATGAPEAIPAEVAELGIVLEKPYDAHELVDEIERQRKTGGVLGKLREVIARRR